MGSLIGGLFGGGPSTAMKENSAEQASLAREFMADYGQRFGEESAIFNQLRSSYAPLIAAGPGQQGFTSPVLAALNTQAINSSAVANRNAQQAVANFGAGRASDSGLKSGVQQQLEASVASNSANQLATAQNQITQANYTTGQQNYWRALGGIDSLAGKENSSATGNLASSQLSSSFGAATKVNDEINAQKAALAGGIASLGIDAATFGMGGIANLGAGESFGEGAKDFLKGGVGALSGQG
jgi:hypothetical protein